jgi:hypothetical protein
VQAFEKLHLARSWAVRFELSGVPAGGNIHLLTDAFSCGKSWAALSESRPVALACRAARCGE